eukprot:2903660-Heterocapsa_arctica.AAC.1
MDEMTFSLREPITMRKININNCRYADDLLTLTQVTTPESVVDNIRAWDQAWDDFCLPELLGQNRGKRQIMVRCMGPGAAESHVRMRTLSATQGMKITETAKHLGV